MGVAGVEPPVGEFVSWKFFTIPFFECGQNAWMRHLRIFVTER